MRIVVPIYLIFLVVEKDLEVHEGDPPEDGKRYRRHVFALIFWKVTHVLKKTSVRQLFAERAMVSEGCHRNLAATRHSRESPALGSPRK